MMEIITSYFSFSIYDKLSKTEQFCSEVNSATSQKIDQIALRAFATARAKSNRITLAKEKLISQILISSIITLILSLKNFSESSIIFSIISIMIYVYLCSTITINGQPILDESIAAEQSFYEAVRSKNKQEVLKTALKQSPLLQEFLKEELLVPPSE